MNRFLKIIILVWLTMVSSAIFAQPLEVNSLRFWTAPDHTRMVFDVSKPVVHQIFLLESPARLVIDFSNARLSKPLPQPPKNHPLFSRVRTGVHHKKDLRVVVDLNTAVTPKSFFLKPRKPYGNRLVVDLFDKKHSLALRKKPVKAVKQIKNKLRDVIIAVDAGHGGEDPGAHGRHGTQEKQVVFKIAQKLSALINKQPGMKAVMVRQGDYYIKLKKRIDIARQAKADLFVSIHADAFKDSTVKGASVFTLSNRGESSVAAKWLAQSENAADLMGGVSLADKEDMLASVLMDLSQTATKEASRQVAQKILKNFKHIGPLHKQGVQKAGFVVLKSPDIPSVLVETAFISNPNEEKKLTNRHKQTKMAQAIFKGILSYFKQYASAGTYFAMKRSQTHVIARGETLSGIAQHYGVSMKSIRSANALVGSVIQIGQVLKIPRG